jgi:serine/threonine protein kinase
MKPSWQYLAAVGVVASLVSLYVMYGSVRVTTLPASPVEYKIGDTVDIPPIGSLLLVDHLGTGRFSKVLLGIQNDVRYAVKFRGDGDVSQLRREVEVLTALNETAGFPRIFGWDERRNFFVMELFDGYKSLAKKNGIDLKHTPMSIPTLTRQLIDRLEQVHSAGFIYGDIHRRNIFINGEEIIKVADFALSRRIDQSSIRGAIVVSHPVVNLYLGSIAEQAGFPLLPIDDVERLAYVLIDTIYESLPWLDVYKMRMKVGETTASASRVTAMLSENSILKGKQTFADNATFFERFKVSPGFLKLVKYVRSFDRVNDVINYDLIRGMFAELSSIVEETNDD